MKLALWLTALTLALVPGCSLSHRSGDFACNADQRCADGRTCVDGFCVIAADSGAVDAPRPGGDAAVCPSQCTSCNAAQKSCTIDCSLNNSACNQAVSCPTGWSCSVMCSTPNSCNNGVNCANATSCTISCGARQTCKNVTCGPGVCKVTCSGSNSCGGSVSCGAGACGITCSGNAACGGSVSCGSACACDVTCQLNAACPNVTCKQGCMGPMPPEFCISAAIGCNTCP